MSLTLNRELEKIVNEEVRSGRYRTAEEVIQKALTALREKPRPHSIQPANARRAAVQEMLEFAEKHSATLSGATIKELIHEGHRL